MGRTSSGADEKLIQTGLALARGRGLGGFSVRELCTQSGVNLGMFHYYFASKENFDQALLRVIYSEMMQDITLRVSPAEPARENVGRVLLSVHHFVHKNRALLSALAGDVLGGNQKILAFILSNFTAHVSVLVSELKRAKKAKELRSPDLADNLVILVAPVALPQMLLGLSDRTALPWGAQMQAAKLRLSSLASAQRRIALLLDAVFKEGV